MRFCCAHQIFFFFAIHEVQTVEYAREEPSFEVRVKMTACELIEKIFETDICGYCEWGNGPHGI
jgi:hypothetical protein